MEGIFTLEIPQHGSAEAVPTLVAIDEMDEKHLEPWIVDLTQQH